MSCRTPACGCTVRRRGGRPVRGKTRTTSEGGSSRTCWRIAPTLHGRSDAVPGRGDTTYPPPHVLKFGPPRRPVNRRREDPEQSPPRRITYDLEFSPLRVTRPAPDQARDGLDGAPGRQPARALMGGRKARTLRTRTKTHVPVSETMNPDMTRRTTRGRTWNRRGPTRETPWTTRSGSSRERACRKKRANDLIPSPDSPLLPPARRMQKLLRVGPPRTNLHRV